MTFEYIFDQDDFQAASQVDIGALQDLIVNENLASATIDHIDMSQIDSYFTVSIVFDVQLSGGDETTLTTIINEYVYVAPGTDVMCLIKDVKSIGTNGGDSIANVWTKRDINTLDGNVNFVTIDSGNNQFTLSEGNYIVNVMAPMCNSYNCQVRLKNVTDTTYSYGPNSFSSNEQVTFTTLTCYLLITAAKTFQLEYFCTNAQESIGEGKATGQSPELYTVINIQKV